MEQLTEAGRTSVLEILRQGRDMTLATMRPDGYPQATTISYANDGLDVYAAIGLGSQKAHNIQHNDKVSATVNLDYEDWRQIRGISLAGNAELVHGTDAIALAANCLLQKFPMAKDFSQGCGTLPWQGLLFLRVRPTVISLLDYRLGFGHTDLYRVWPDAHRALDRDATP